MRLLHLLHQGDLYVISYEPTGFINTIHIYPDNTNQRGQEISVESLGPPLLTLINERIAEDLDTDRGDSRLAEND